jgi:hypothetical protein
MTAVEGLSLREAAEWCGGRLTMREAARLRRQAEGDCQAAPADAGNQVEPPATIKRAGS